MLFPRKCKQARREKKFSTLFKNVENRVNLLQRNKNNNHSH